MDAELEKLLAAAKAKVDAMTPEERDEMFRQQAAGYAKAEMSWPEPKYKIVDGVKVYDSYEDYCNG